MQDAGQILFLSSEGVDILPVKPNQKANYGPHQSMCSTQGSCPVKTKHAFISRILRTSASGSSLCWR